MLLQNPRNSNNIFDTLLSQLTLFTIIDLAKWQMGHTATHGLLSQNPSELEDSMAVRSTLGSRGLRHTLLCSFQPTLWSLGQVKTYLRAVLKGSPWAGSTRGAAPGLTWNWCCCVILWEQAQFQMHLFLEVNLLEIVFEMPWFTFSRYLINTGKETFLYKKAML